MLPNTKTGTDLNDDLSDLLGGQPGEFASAKQPPAFYAEQIAPSYFEKCGKCGGSGQTRWGTCFRCKGKGGKSFKTPTAKRAKARGQREERKQRSREEFRAEHKAEIEFLSAIARRANNTWAAPADLLAKLDQYGSWTNAQVAAIQRWMEKDAERKAQRKAQQVEREASAKTVDVTKIEAAFAKFRSQAASENSNVSWLKLPLDTFVFSHAPAKGEWPEAIFIKEGDRKLGRIAKGKFIRSFACDDATEARVITAAADPAAAARAYGLKWNTCCCCGRTLTNEESRKAGIGPICAERWGF